ncbi:sulfite exporter TauE/SafE family protein [Methylocystis parvus]|uniref:LysM peptidoglycan-binding domain-containing protein n=1 Tax=Methylocystis parvus TaxID=134 RepID=A0A6B8LXP6_9HYPH|nr:sulfite exporter TauE/SafE family protein [Methylocystis parvus]QGM97167.1 LysM peptidoglycan-binding domain-containing protein [Methylocystis parvus]WBJ98928.1 sulfite exporter TauE/SafE family protein [Methylocystis parvus OBBP]
MSDETVNFHAHGMHCQGCEHVIETGLKRLAGVRSVRAHYPTETVAVEYDAALLSFDAICENVEANGYKVELGERKARPFAQRLALIAGALAGLAALAFIDSHWISAGGAPDISQHMSLWLIFALGLVTGFHCIGMCGAFVVSYSAADASAGRASLLSHVAFGAGKTLSYTSIGALFGALGAFIAFTPLLRGAAGIAAGLFLIVFGLNMLGLFAPLRRFRLGLPAPLERWVYKEADGRHRPFVIGLLNGLMIACGPLQAMYVMAAGTGSPVEGAKMLFAFGLGTLPVMLAFGVIASTLSNALTHRLLKASGVIVVALGAVMINRGLILTGWGYDLVSIAARLHQEDAPVAARIPAPSVQKIEMEANAKGYAPTRFTLVKDVPVQWTINAAEVTECNKRIIVPALHLEFDLKPGLQTVSFTPRQAGVVPWSCWMGMIRGEFDVVEPGAAPKEEASPAPAKEEAAPPVAAGPARPSSYAVQGGDTLKSVAKKFYGDARRAGDIAAANPGLRKKNLRKKKLKPGQLLILPKP